MNIERSCHCCRFVATPSRYVLVESVRISNQEATYSVAERYGSSDTYRNLFPFTNHSSASRILAALQAEEATR